MQSNLAHKNADEASSCYTLPEVLDIAASFDFHSELMSLINYKKISFDASGVRLITTPCIQLLIAFYNFALKNQIDISLSNASEVFDASLREFGLSKTQFYQDFILKGMQ